MTSTGTTATADEAAAKIQDDKGPEEDHDSALAPDQHHVALDVQQQQQQGSGEESAEAGNANVEPKRSKMETLEIDNGDDEEAAAQNNGLSKAESFDDDMDETAETEDLLGQGKNGDKANISNTPRRPCCSKPERVGNMRIFLPRVFDKTGWGIAGPHFLGPVCVLLLVGFASRYFILISWRNIGPITSAICALFTLACAYNLCNVAYRDPGVVLLQPAAIRNPQDTDNDDQRLQFRWCDRCQVFQPVDGAHCADCNVCIAGFDHHCVWMGTCIGKKNFKQFVKFNITWLLYLIFAITWVSVLGPIIFHPKKL